MRLKHLISLTIAAAMIAAPVSRANADAHGLIGAIIGGAIVGSAINNANKNRPRTKTVVRTVAPSATRAANRETQIALNYFGYNAGTPDGVLGRNSRAAISAMQAYMNFPITGRLTQFERDVLIGAYQRGIAGSYETVQLVSNDPDGTKALLVAQRDILTGGATTPRRTTGYAGLPIEVSEAVDEIAHSSDPTPEQLLQRAGFIQMADLNDDGNNDYILDTSVSGSSFWCNSVQCKALVFVSTPNGYARNDLLAFDPEPATFSCVGAGCVVNDVPVMASSDGTTTDSSTTMASSEGSNALPLFSVPGTAVSLDSHCSKVSLMTNANGGFTQASSMSDPAVVMNEQFCLARAFAIENSARLVAQIGGLSDADVDANCNQYGPALKEYVSVLGLKPRGAVVSDVGEFVAGAQMDPAQLLTTAKICLGSGYRQNDLNLALGAGMLLVALGEAPYGELMGHHLFNGFGTSERADLAMDWYQDALDALMAGAQPVFAPDQPDRPYLLQAAVDMMRGGDAPPVQAIEASGTKAKLPTFGATKSSGSAKK